MKKRKVSLALCIIPAISILLTSTGAALNEKNSDNMRRGIYIREVIDYDPDYVDTIWEYEYLGSVSGDNTTSAGELEIEYIYTTSGTVTGSFGAYAKASAEAGVILAKASGEAGLEVSASRSWTEGRSSGAYLTIPPYSFQILEAYIPGVNTGGRLVYKVWMDGYEDDWFEQTESISDVYAPAEAHIHFKVRENLNTDEYIKLYDEGYFA